MLDRLEAKDYVGVFEDLLACTSEVESKKTLPINPPKVMLEDDFDFNGFNPQIAPIKTNFSIAK